MIDKDTSTGVEIGLLGLASGSEESSLARRYKVIHGDTLSRMDMVGLEDPLSIFHNCSGAALGWPCSLFGTLASGTSRELLDRTAAVVKILL